MIHNSRKFGKAPYKIILIHGGPGAPGGLLPLAQSLAANGLNVLEPFQNADSIPGQIEELKTLVDEDCTIPVVLIGHSWGAWLAWIFTAHNPNLVKKLILVGAGPFEEEYSLDIMKTRLSRLRLADRIHALKLSKDLQNRKHPNQKGLFKNLGTLMTRADTFAPLTEESHVLEFQPDIFNAVWPQAKALREFGKLLEMGRLIHCPVVAIHGDYDPHPAEGVKKPLSKLLQDFNFVKLEKCGHYPWNEKFAKKRFYEILLGEFV